MKTSSSMRAWFYGVIAFSILGATAAQAAGDLNFTPPDTDLSYQYLSSIFGVVDGVLHGVGGQVMGVMFGIFNSAVLALGGIIVTYTLLVSTLNTAHEGEVMGKKWSSIWIPLRSAFGVALLLPKTSGYSIIQTLIMWVVVQGVGVADSIWSSVLHYLKNGGVVIMRPVSVETMLNESLQGAPNMGGGSQRKFSQGLADLMRNQVCVYGIQELLEKKRNAAIAHRHGQPPPPVPYFGANMDPLLQPVARGTQSMALPPVTYNGVNLRGVCGKVNWAVLASTQSADSNPFSSNIKNSRGEDKGLLSDARSMAVEQIILDLGSAAQDYVQNFRLDSPQAVGGCPSHGPCNFQTWNDGKPSLLSGAMLKNTFRDYYAIMLTALRGAPSKEDTAWMDRAEFDGWALAGSWFFQLASYSAKVQRMFDNLPPTIDAVTPQSICASNSPLIKSSVLGASGCEKLKSWVFSSSLKNYLNGADKYSTGYARGVFAGRTRDDYGRSLSNKIPLPDDDDIDVEELKKVLDDVSVSYIQAMHSAASNNIETPDPMVKLVREGVKYITIVTDTWIAYLGILTGIAILAFLPSGAYALIGIGVLMALTPLIVFFTGYYFAVGVTLAFYLPMVPLIIYVLGVLGWFIGVIESMVAAPIVALGVMHPDGQHEFLGRSEQGVMLLLNVFLRPAMMVMGLIGGIALSYVGMWVLDQAFLTLTQTLNSEDAELWDQGTYLNIMSGWVGMITLGLKAVISVSVVSRSYQLIHLLPDRVLRWLSGGIQESLGSEGAGEAIQGARGQTGQLQGSMQAFGQAGQQAGSAITQAAGGKGPSSEASVDSPSSGNTPGADGQGGPAATGGGEGGEDPRS